MKPLALIGAVVAFLASSTAIAQPNPGEILDSAAGLIGGIIANSKLQRDVASMSAPLQYETSVPPADPANPRDPRNFDIAGVRLGMAPEQVIQTTGASGYVVKDKVMIASFDTEVRRRVNGGSPTSIRSIEVPYAITFAGPDRQEVKVEFIALPEGPAVEAVSYTMNGDKMGSDAFAAQVERKYGEPVQRDPDVLLWCVGSGEPCEGDWNHRPHMKVDVQAKSIDLRNEDDARDAALQARIDAEVAARRRTVSSAQF